MTALAIHDDAGRLVLTVIEPDAFTLRLDALRHRDPGAALIVENTKAMRFDQLAEALLSGFETPWPGKAEEPAR